MIILIVTIIIITMPKADFNNIPLWYGLTGTEEKAPGLRWS